MVEEVKATVMVMMIIVVTIITMKENDYCPLNFMSL